MLLKLLTLIGVAFAVWSMARRALGGPAAPPPPAGADVADLVRCTACGAWRAPGETCVCSIPPTP